MAANDWREKLGVESRGRVFNKIFGTMKKIYPFSGEEELKQIGLSFEKKIYSAATSQADYLRRISVKMLTMESKSQSSTANSLQTGDASHSMQSNIHSQGLAIPIVGGQSQGQQQSLSQNMQNTISAASVQNSGSLASTHPAVNSLTQGSIANGVGQNSNSQSMQNDSNVAQNSLGNSMGQEMPPNMFANSQRQMQGRKQVQQQQLMKQKLQSGGMTQSMLQSHVQKQHQNPMQTAQIQPASVSSLQENYQSSAQQSTQQMLERQPQPVLRQHRQQQTQQIPILHQQQTSMAHQQPLTGPVSCDSGIQQNQLIGQQKNIQDLQQHSLMSQQNNGANLQQQQLNIQQNNVLNMNQPQLGGGVYGLQQSFASSGMPNNPHSAHMMQQKVPVQQQLQQNMQLIVSQMQSNSLQRDMQQRLPTSGAMPQQQNLAEQQNQIFQSQRAIQEASSSSLDSTAKTGNAGARDWQEEVYQKIKSMKDAYLLELEEISSKVVTKLQQYDALPQQHTNEQLTKLNILKSALEKIVVFLQVSKNDIQIDHKDKLGSVEKQIAKILSSTRQNRHHMVAASHNSGSSVPSISNSHQNIINSLQQQPSLSSELGPDSTPCPPQQVPGLNSSKQNNTLSGLRSIPSQAGVNTVQSNLNYLRTNSNMLQNQKMLHSQQLKRQMHQKQMQQHLSAHLPGHTESSDVKTRQQMGVKPGVYQQQHSSNQQSAAATYASPQVKPGSPFSIPSPQVLQAGSPQVPQQPSPQINQQNLVTFSKTGTPLHSANSPFISPSPSTPVAPSPIHSESEKVNASLSPLTNTNMGQPEASNAAGSAQSLAIGTSGISASPLLAELSSQDGVHGNPSTVISGRSNTVERPIERLIKAVKSASKNALSASVSDINSVVSMIDRIGGSVPGNGSGAAVGEDLVAMTKWHLQDRNFFVQDGPLVTRKHKRSMTATPSTVVSSAGSVSNSVKDLAGSDAFDMVESTATSHLKRSRIEINKSLSEEILDINRRLIDTLVEISDEEDVDPTAIAAVAEGGNGTIVKCSFNAVSLSPGLKSKYASPHMSPIEPLRMLIPINYPNCSPILFDNFPAHISKECEDLSMKAKFRFSISLRSLSHPLSLTEMAKTWNNCARAVIFEHAQQSGGGTFSSKYGTWENCIGAS